MYLAGQPLRHDGLNAVVRPAVHDEVGACDHADERCRAYGEGGKENALAKLRTNHGDGLLFTVGSDHHASPRDFRHMLAALETKSIR